MGSIYSLLVLAVHVTSNIIGIDDFSIEGSFATGSALGLILTNMHVPTGITIACILLSGMFVGLITTILHTIIGIESLLAGIIVTTGLFSCNLKMAGAQGSLEKTIFDVHTLTAQNHWLILVPLALSMTALIRWLLTTETGLFLHAVGNNPHFITLLGKNPKKYIALGPVIANSLASLAGFLFVHHTGFFSITGSIGVLISALAGLIIGASICGSWIGGSWLGAVLYQAIITTVIYQQLDPVWNKLITASIIVVHVMIKHMKKQNMRRLS